MVGAAIEDVDAVPAAPGALHLLSCVGNRVRDAQGALLGAVAGKRGGLAPGHFAPNLVAEIFRIALDLNKDGTTILLVEQNANRALEIAHRAYVLETGVIVLSDTGQNLLTNPKVKEAYLGG